MWHPLSRVAQSRRLDFHNLREFARENHVKFKIIYSDLDDPMVSNWFVDDLILAFRVKVNLK